MNRLKEKIQVEIDGFETIISQLSKLQYLNSKEINNIDRKIIELNKEIDAFKKEIDKVFRFYDRMIAILVSLIAAILLPLVMYNLLMFMGIHFIETTSFALKNIYGIIMLVCGVLIMGCGPKFFRYISNKTMGICSNMIINSSFYKRKCGIIENKKNQLEELYYDKDNLMRKKTNIIFECSKYMASIKMKKWLLNNIDTNVVDIDFNNDEVTYENISLKGKKYTKKR